MTFSEDLPEHAADLSDGVIVRESMLGDLEALQQSARITRGMALLKNGASLLEAAGISVHLGAGDDGTQELEAVVEERLSTGYDMVTAPKGWVYRLSVPPSRVLAVYDVLEDDVNITDSGVEDLGPYYASRLSITDTGQIIARAGDGTACVVDDPHYLQPWPDLDESPEA